MNNRRLIDMADGAINEVGGFKVGVQFEDSDQAYYHLDRAIGDLMELKRTLFLETRRSGEVSSNQTIGPASAPG